VVPPVASWPRIGVPHLSGSSKSELSSARRRAIHAIEREIELPELEWRRAVLEASAGRRIPLAGAEILRRYDSSKSAGSEKAPTPEATLSLTPSTATALQKRAEFTSKVRSGSYTDLSSSDSLTSSGKTLKKSSADKANGGSTVPGNAGPMTGASSSAIDSDIHSPSKGFSNSGSGDGDGDGSTGDGWDDNFGDGSGDNDSGNDGCNDCNNDHYCDDHWHGGWSSHWGWWPQWGWHGGWGMSYASWCGWYGWYGWYRSPWYYRYYGYNPWWYGYNYAPTVVSSTIYSTEIIEVPVVHEVQVPVEQGVIAGAEANSPSEVQSALHRAAVEYLALGDRAFAEERYGDAVRHYARAVECSPDDPVLHLVLSDALFATGDYHYAAHSLRRALELQPNLLEVQFDKRSFYGDPSGFDHHLLLLEGYLADHVLDDDARMLLGANYLFGGNPEGTVTLFSDTFGKTVMNSDAGRLLLAAAHRAIAAR